MPAPTAPPGRPSPLPGAPVSHADAALRPILAEAGAVALAHRGHLDVSRKDDGSVVTAADRAAERVLVAGIRAAWPDDALEGEEGAAREGSAPDARRWVIDPIDGTAAFVEGLAHWGPTVARIDAGEVQVGALWMPRLAEHYFFERGVGAFRNGAPLAPLGAGRVRRGAVLYVPSRLHRVVRLDWPGKARNLGSHAAHLCLVAAGAAQAVLIGPGWSTWDTAAGLALIEAVGGVARRLPDGAPLHVVRDAAAPFVAGTAAAVEHLLQPDALRALS